MKPKAPRLLVAVAVLSLLATSVARADDDGRGENESANRTTIAVFGDWPYSAELLQSAPLLVDSINSDPKVRLVLHVGDIHSGSMPCTGVGLDPTPAKAVPGWNQGIFDIFQQFKDPVVYTPGDNEWTDCHKNKEFATGAPLLELAAVRNLFFPTPGVTIGGRKKKVASQALVDNHQFPGDAQFVENVLWEESRVVFVTLNVPGSNDDGLPWTGGAGNPFLDETARMAEVLGRDAANLRWLDRAFDLAESDDARGVLIGLQADMWDPAAIVPGGDGLNNYDALVQEIATRARHFGRPVLLINGDSHLFETDKPLSAAFYADPATVGDFHHVGYAVDNFTRITVQGSTNKPGEWLRLTIDPHSASVFSWENVVYCESTNTACFP